MTAKRKCFLAKIQERENSSKPGTENLPKDKSSIASQGTGKINEHELTTDKSKPVAPVDSKLANDDTTVPVQESLPVLKSTPEEQLVPSTKISPETNTEGDDGWQPVQRPRSAGGYGRQVRQRRAANGKVYGYQKKEAVVTDHARLNNSLQGTTNYHAVKKRTLSPENYTDQHTTGAPQVSKFGRRVVEAVTYRVKSVPSSVKDESKESTRENEPGQNLEKVSIVRLGKSPSYKDVAVAPPGTISKLHSDADETNDPIETENSVWKYEDSVSQKGEVKVNNVTEINYPLMDSEMSLSDQKNLETNPQDGVVGTVEPSMIGPIDIHEVVPENGDINDGVPSISSSDVNFDIDDCCSEPQNNAISSSAVDDQLEDKPMVTSLSDPRDIPARKLSASAAPFKPLPIGTRAGSLPVTMNHHSGPSPVPAVGPWPILHAYPSPPGTPNIIQQVPFIYPPYSQAHVVPSNGFPPSGSHFHHNHYSWQCSMSPATPVWHPIEFSMVPPVVEPISESVFELNPLSPSSEGRPGVAPVLFNEDGGVEEEKKEVVLSMPEETCNANKWIDLENEKQDYDASKESFENSRSNHQVEDDGRTLSILIRGKRNRKQTLRVPISLLRRPYCSQSFKIAYSRVFRDSETARPVPLSSC